MANRDFERPAPTDSPEADVGVEQQFIDMLGTSAGAEAYQHMSAVIELLERAPGPSLNETLQAQISSNGIDPKLIVAESSTSYIVANNAEHAEHLRRDLAYRRLVGLGEIILRAPQ